MAFWIQTKARNSRWVQAKLQDHSRKRVISWGKSDKSVCCMHYVFKLIFVLHFTSLELVIIGSSTGANVVDAVLKPYKTLMRFQCCVEIEECVECLSSEQVLEVVRTKPKCVTQHPGFRQVCLQKGICCWLLINTGLQIIFLPWKDICPTRAPFWSDKRKI